MKPSATRIEQENGSSSGKQERRNSGRATAAVGVTLPGVQRTPRSTYLYAIARDCRRSMGYTPVRYGEGGEWGRQHFLVAAGTSVTID